MLMRYISFAALLSVVSNISALPNSMDPTTIRQSIPLSEAPGPEEVRISNIQVTKDLMATPTRFKRLFRWEPTIISIDFSWDGHPGSCTCYRPTKRPMSRKDTCVAVEQHMKFRIQMENRFNDGSAAAKLFMQEGFNEIGVFLDIKVNESDCKRKRFQYRKVCKLKTEMILKTVAGRKSTDRNWGAFDLKA